MLYRHEIFRSSSLPCAVLSVGNITTGGTGKTPTVIEMAKIFRAHGKRVAILTRGYRRKASQPNFVVTADSEVEETGDEPLLMLSKLGDVPIIVGSSRYASGRLALERFQSDVLLLDDGFQHIQCVRSADFVLIDATNPFGGGYLLPAGFLREPLSHLSRATAFLITRSNEVADISPITLRLRQIAPHAPIFTAQHVVETIRKIGSTASLDAATLQTQRLLAVCGLGNPDSFRRLLTQQQLTVAAHLDFPDHHWYTGQDVELLRRTLTTQRLDAIITTEKDESKLFTLASELGAPAYVIAIRMAIQPQDKFECFLLDTFTATR